MERRGNLFQLIFGSLPIVIYLKCNLKDVLEVVVILSGDVQRISCFNSYSNFQSISILLYFNHN